MSLFDNDASNFISKLSNIDASGIRDLIQQVNDLTKSASELEQKFGEASQSGTTLTKTQRNAWKELTADIQNTVKAQEQLSEAIRKTWDVQKSTPKNQTAQKKELSDKLNAYKELRTAVAKYQASASSASRVAEPVHNKKATAKNEYTIDTGEKEQPKKDVSVEQKTEQLNKLAETANKTKEAIREAVEETVSPNGGDRFKWGQSKKYFVNKSKEGGGSFENVVNTSKLKNGQVLSKEEALRSGLPIMTPEKLEEMAKKSAEGSGKANSPFGETTYSLNELEAKIEEIQSKIQAFRQSIKDNPDANVFQSSLDSLKSMESELKDLQSLRNTYMGKPTKETPEKPQTPQASTAQVGNIEQEQQGLHGLLGTLREVISVRAQLASARTALPFSADAEASQASIKALEGRLRGLQTILGSMKGAPAIQALSSAFSAARTAVANFANIARQGLDAIISGAQRVGSALASVASTGFHTLVSSAQGAVGAFNALNSGARTAISTIASLAGKGFGALKTGLGAAVSGVQNLIGKFQTLSGNVSKKLTHSISGIKSMLMRRLKRTFITSIFNQAKQGLQEFAKYSEAFNESMSSIKNSAKQTAGNMSVTLGNLVNLIAPALNALLGIINSVLTALNSLFALLGGKSTVTTAKKSTDNYAKSLKGAGGAAKDLNHQLYGFDELTRQEDQSGGGGGGGSAIGYEESPIAENLKSFFDKIKEAWEAGKFEEVGRLIGEQLNNIIYKIDDFFIQLRPKAVEWAVKIARVLNGLTAEWDAYATGKMIADGLNLAFDTVYNFISTYDFGVLGRKLAEGLNGLFENTEWDLVGKTFAEFFNSLWETVANFAKNARWRYYGDQLALGINSFFGELDLDMWHDAIVDSVNGIFETLNNLISRTKWDEISKKITSALKRVVTDIKWQEIAKTFSMLFNNVLNVADNLIKSGAISELGGQIGDMIGYALRNINWRKLGRIVANGWAEISKAFKNFVKNLNLPELGKKLAEGIQSMFDNIDWNARKDALVTSVNEVFSGIGNAIRGVNWKKFAKEAAESTNSILSEIKWDEIGQTLADGVNAAFGVISEWISTFEWANLGKYLGDCLLTFVNGVNWEDVRTSISGFITGLTDAFNELVESDVMSTLGSRLGKLVNGVLSDINFVDLGDKVKGGIKEITEAFSNFIKECDLKNIASQLADGVNAFFDPKSGADFTYVAGKMSEGLNEIIASFQTFITELDLVSIAQRLGGFIKNFILETDIESLVGTITTGAVKVATAMAEFVSTAMAPDEETGENIGDKLAKAVNGSFVGKRDEFEDLGKSIGEAIKNTLENIDHFLTGTDWNAVGAALGNALGKINLLDVGKALVKALVLGIKAAVESLGGAIGGFIASLFNIQTVETFNGKGTQWANELYNGFSEELKNGEASAVNNVAATAALIAGGFKKNLVMDNLFGDAQRDAMIEARQFAQDLAGALNNREFSDMILGNYKWLGFEIDKELASSILENKDLDDTAVKQLMEIVSNASSGQEILDAFKMFGIELPQQVENGIRSAIPGLTDEAEKLLLAIQEPLASGADIQNAFAEYGIGVGEAFANAIAGQASDDVAAALFLLGEGVDDGLIAALDMANLSENLDAFMQSSGMDIKQTASLLMNNSKDELVDIAKQLGIDVGTNLGEITPEALKKAIIEGKASVKEAADEMAKIADTSEQKSNMEANAQQSAEGVTNTASSTLENGQGKVGSATDTAISPIQEKFNALPEEVQGYAEQLVDYVCTALMDEDGTVKAAIESMAQAAVDRAKEILSGDEGTKIAQAFIDGIKTPLNYGAGYEMSSNLMIGFYNGFSNNARIIQASMSIWATNLVALVKRIFQIRSPSKVFEDIGGYVMEGMAIGLEDSGKDAVNAVSDVAKAMIEEGNNFSLGENIDATTSGLDVVADKLADIANIFSAIADTITQMGGLEIPTIAAGQTIPYRTQLGASSNGFGETTLDSTAIENAFYSAITRAMSNSDNTQNVNVYLDGRQIADSVTKYQRRNVRAMGV